MDISTAIKVLSGLAKIARHIGCRRLLFTLRTAASWKVLRNLHINVLHEMRRLAREMGNPNGNRDSAAQIAQNVCGEARKLLGYFLELDSHKLHCCLKVMVPQTGPGDPDKVATWVRSDPLDDRPIELGDDNAYSVAGNSVWSALLGRSDTKTNWQPFNCFSCNDLRKHGDLFVCARQNWQKYYRSALVFPIRYPRDSLGSTYRYIGFLPFDSPDADVFRGLPDIFDFRERRAEYHAALEQSAIFHLGAVLADCLGTFLGPVYEHRQEQKEVGT